MAADTATACIDKSNALSQSIADIVFSFPRSDLLDKSSSNYVLKQVFVIDKLKQLCLEGVSSWSNIEKQYLHVSLLVGGASNMIFKVCLTKDYLIKDEDRCLSLQATTSVNGMKPKEVLLRIFGELSCEFGVDRNLEFKCLSLAQNEGLCPACINIFNGGRIEEYVTNSRNWNSSDMMNVEKTNILVKNNKISLRVCYVLLFYHLSFLF